MKYRIPLGLHLIKENKVKFITYSFLLSNYWFHFGICLPDFRYVFCKKNLKGLKLKVQKDYIEVEENV